MSDDAIVINLGLGVGSAGDELLYNPKILDDSGAEDTTVDQPAGVHLDMGGLTSAELGIRGVFGDTFELGGVAGLSWTQGSLRQADISESAWSADEYLQSELRVRLSGDFLYRTPTFASWFQALVGARLNLSFANMGDSTGTAFSYHPGEIYTGGDHNFDTRMEGQEIGSGEDGVTAHQSTRLLFGGAVQGGLRIRPGDNQSGWGAPIAFTVIGRYAFDPLRTEIGSSQEATFVSRDSSGSAFFSDLNRSKGWENFDSAEIVFGIELIR